MVHQRPLYVRDFLNGGIVHDFFDDVRVQLLWQFLHLLKEILRQVEIHQQLPEVIRLFILFKVILQLPKVVLGQLSKTLMACQ